MKITDKRTDPAVLFNTLCVGDVFLYEGQVFMRIQEVGTLSGFARNAVDLENGRLCTM